MLPLQMKGGEVEEAIKVAVDRIQRCIRGFICWR